MDFRFAAKIRKKYDEIDEAARYAQETGNIENVRVPDHVTVQDIRDKVNTTDKSSPEKLRDITVLLANRQTTNSILMKVGKTREEISGTSRRVTNKRQMRNTIHLFHMTQLRTRHEVCAPRVERYALERQLNTSRRYDENLGDQSATRGRVEKTEGIEEGNESKGKVTEVRRNGKQRKYYSIIARNCRRRNSCTRSSGESTAGATAGAHRPTRTCTELVLYGHSNRSVFYWSSCETDHGFACDLRRSGTCPETQKALIGCHVAIPTGFVFGAKTGDYRSESTVKIDDAAPVFGISHALVKSAISR